MALAATNPQDYLAAIPAERRQILIRLRKIIHANLPPGFEEAASSGMLSFVVPHSNYPAGYHCHSKQPLPFISLASQKNFISLYHMGLYAMPNLLHWFLEEYPKHRKAKPDMGKSCIRFKKPDDIPDQLVGELMKKVSPEEWIHCYENVLKHTRKSA